MSDDSFVETNQFHWYTRIIGASLELITLVLFLIHVYKTYLWKFKGTGARKKVLTGTLTAKWRKLSQIFTMLTLFSYNIMGGNYVINYWSLYGSSISCTAVEVFSVFSYHLCKLFLYIVLVLRIKVAFSESAYHDEIQKILYFLYTVLLLYCIVICLDFIVIGGEISYTSSDMFYCALMPLPSWGVLTFLTFDLVISFSCCAAFIYPLRKLLKQTNASSQQTYIELIRKYAILTTSAIVSTLVFVFLNAALSIGFFILLDNIINAFCILFMSSWYQSLYDRLCCCCTKTIETIEDVTNVKSKSRTSNVSHEPQVPSSDGHRYTATLPSVTANDEPHRISASNDNERTEMNPMDTVQEEDSDRSDSVP